MDLASDVIAVLSPYLAQAGDSAASSIGSSVVDASKALLDSIRRRLSHDDASAAAVVEAWIERPADAQRQADMRALLGSAIDRDDTFSREVSEQLVTTTDGQPVWTFLTATYGGTVGKVVNIGTAQSVHIE